jgi:hypothetical protein
MADRAGPAMTPEAAYEALQASLAPAPALSPKQARLLALFHQEQDNHLSLALLNAYNGAPPLLRKQSAKKPPPS